MLERAAGALPGEASTTQVAANTVDAQVNAMVLSNPVGELGGGPGALSLGELGAHGVEDGRSEGRVLAAAWFVEQGIKAALKEGFEPGADGLFMLAEVESDARCAPACISETKHLEAVTRAGGKSTLAGALAKLSPLFISQGDTIHSEKHTKIHKLSPPIYLVANAGQSARKLHKSPKMVQAGVIIM